MTKRKWKKVLVWSLGAIAALLTLGVGLSVYRSVTAEYEEPEYSVISTHDGYEIREYPPHVVAETRVSGDFRTAGSAGFRRLAGYIFGKNEARKKMSMTAPVESESGTADGVKMKMTAPVESEKNDEGDTVYRFMMEREYAIDELPRPLDPRVTLREVPRQRIAVGTFSGRWRSENYEAAARDLRAALEKDAVAFKDAPRFCAFNDPFTLPFLRRNEVHLSVLD